MKTPTLKQLLPILIVAFAIAVFMLLKITAPVSAKATPQPRSWQIQTLTITPQTLSPQLTLYGQIESPDVGHATAPKRSRVTALYVQEGSPIEKGQLLLTLKKKDFKPRVKQAQAQVAELHALINSEHTRYKMDKQSLQHEKTLLTLKQSALRRAKQLKQKNLGSTAQVEQAEEALQQQQLALASRQQALTDHNSRLLQLQARLANAQADVELAELDLERSSVIAPFNGFVQTREVGVGNQVNENQVLLSFYDTEKLEVRAKIPATFQQQINQTLRQQTQLNATADYSGIQLKLQLNRLSGNADVRGTDALFSITEGSEWVKPGSVISLNLQQNAKHNLIALPYSAIFDNNRIYKVVNEHLQRLHVKIEGSYTDDKQGEQRLVSSEELNSGDIIMITHLPNAIHGLKVSPL